MAELNVNVTVTVPAGISRVQFRDGIAREYSYPEFLEDGKTPNTEDKEDFIKRLTAEGWIKAFQSDLVKQASQTQRDTNALARDGFVIS